MTPAHSVRLRPKVVLFDAVGTLIECQPSVAEAYHRAGVRHGSSRTIEEIDQAFVRAFRQHATSHQTSRAIERERWRTIIEAVFDDVPDAGGPLFEDLWRHFAAPKHWAAYEETSRVLNELAGHGYQLGVASNFDERLPPILRQLCPRIESGRVFHSADVGWAKPDPRFYDTVRDALEIEASEILMVGDHWANDFAGPVSAGWQAIELRRSHSTATAEIRAPAVPGRITTLDALSTLLE